MSKSLSSIIKSTLAATVLTVASTGAYAANAVGVARSEKPTLEKPNAWNMGMNHIMQAGGSISATNQGADKHSYTSNPDLDGASWGHFGSWYTFMTHDVATTTISVTATDTVAMSPGFTVWRTDGEFDGGTGGTGELSSKSKGTPHSFNQVGAAGEYGTYWMTDAGHDIYSPIDGSVSGKGATANGITETMGYANDGAHMMANGWGQHVHNDGVQDGYAELTLTDLAAGWYLIFVGGADGSLAGSNINLNVSSVNSVSSVPVPAAVYLFGSALAGLFVSSRRKLAVTKA